MTARKKKKEANTEIIESAYPMMDAIAKLSAAYFDDSGEFDYDSSHTVLLCDLIFKLYMRGEYMEAIETLATAFLIAGMEHAGEMQAIVTSGYTDELGAFYLRRFFDHSDLYETYVLGRQILDAGEDDDGEDDSYM